MSKSETNILHFEESPDDIMTLVTYPQMTYQERYEFKKTLVINNKPKYKSDKAGSNDTKT
jgi:hypothetical protein